jgi:antitoxin FitA
MQFGCTIRIVSKTIQIRDVPDSVHAELRSRAAANGVSLSDYLLREATRIAGRPALSDILVWAGERGWGVASGEAGAALREIRDGSTAT